MIESDGRQDLGHKNADHVEKFIQYPLDVPAAQHAVPLRQDPFRGQGSDEFFLAMDRLRRLFLHGEIQNRGEAERAKDADGVLLEAILSVSDGADQPLPQIPFAAKIPAAFSAKRRELMRES